jgi:hypothetical protein
MLPLLPALILLLLQGPSNFERLAVDGRLPAALEAINRQMTQPGAEKLSEREEQALASFIAAGTSAQLTRALMSFLWQSKEPRPTTQHLEREPARAITSQGDSPPPQDGFRRSQRTRDGPAIFGAAF